MNGVTFTGTGLQFTYYDMRAVYVSLLRPRGGPRQGATALRVTGYGFRDLTGGVGGYRPGVLPASERRQGLKCKFGDNDMVPATLDRYAVRGYNVCAPCVGRVSLSPSLPVERAHVLTCTVPGQIPSTGPLQHQVMACRPY